MTEIATAGTLQHIETRDKAGKELHEQKGARKFISSKNIMKANGDTGTAVKMATGASVSSSLKVIKIGNHVVKIKEYAASDYGLFIWPCSIVLGCYLHQHHQELCASLFCDMIGALYGFQLKP